MFFCSQASVVRKAQPIVAVPGRICLLGNRWRKGSESESRVGGSDGMIEEEQLELPNRRSDPGKCHFRGRPQTDDGDRLYKIRHV